MAFNFTFDILPIRALLITTSILVCLHGKLISIYSQYLIVIKLLHICRAICLNKKVNVPKPWNRHLKIHYELEQGPVNI